MPYELTRTAAMDLRGVYRQTISTWGEDQAERYIDLLYAAFENLATAPWRDTSRNRRAAPFRMVAAREHFVIYDLIGDRVIVLAILHQAMDIERRIARLTPTFYEALAKTREA